MGNPRRQARFGGQTAAQNQERSNETRRFLQEINQDENEPERESTAQIDSAVKDQDIRRQRRNLSTAKREGRVSSSSVEAARTRARNETQAGRQGPRASEASRGNGGVQAGRTGRTVPPGHKMVFGRLVRVRGGG